MDARAIVSEAHAYGISLTAEASRIIARPAANMTDDLRRAIRDNKDTLLAYLTRQAANTDPAGPCPECGGGQWWQLPGESWHCRACEPDMPLTATTLTLPPCHQADSRPVRDPARLQRMIEAACKGSTITPAQLRAELADDLPDLESGALTERGLRLTAETLAIMRNVTAGTAQ